MRRKKQIVLIMLCAVAIFSLNCTGLQVPPEKNHYVGVWQSVHGSPSIMQLTITSNGQVKYRRIDPGRIVSINSNIKEWNGNNFKVGLLFATTEFVVQRTPYRSRGRWHMVVDGVNLVRR